MALSHSLDKVDHGDCIGRNSMIRPAKIMIEGDCKRWSAWLITLRERGGEKKEEGREGMEMGKRKSGDKWVHYFR